MLGQIHFDWKNWKILIALTKHSLLNCCNTKKLTKIIGEIKKVQVHYTIYSHFVGRSRESRKIVLLSRFPTYHREYKLNFFVSIIIGICLGNITHYNYLRWTHLVHIKFQDFWQQVWINMFKVTNLLFKMEKHLRQENLPG